MPVGGNHNNDVTGQKMVVGTGIDYMGTTYNSRNQKILFQFHLGKRYTDDGRGLFLYHKFQRFNLSVQQLVQSTDSGIP